MKKETLKLTTAQFARLHGVNKRTLHYYDNIGLFSPSTKGENNYRYYDILQSIDFEYIRMLKDLNMSIEEIKTYLANPNPQSFITIAETKINDINTLIKNLKKTKKKLEIKKQQIEFCNTIDKQHIEIRQCPEEKILVTPYNFVNEDYSYIFSDAKTIWDIEQIRQGIGSYIAVEKIRCDNFEDYEGLFTPAAKSSNHQNIVVKPAGQYLCGYQKGLWEELPDLYRKMLDFAQKEQLHLSGYAYEMGLNDFVIASDDEYITQIMIKID